MPFTTNERELLLGIFRLTMAVSAHRVDDASREFSNLLTTYEEQIRNLTTVEPHCNDDQISTISDCSTHASMPSLVRIYNPTQTPSVTDSVGFKPPTEVELIITEPVSVQVEVPKRVTRENAVIESQEQEQEQEQSQAESAEEEEEVEAEEEEEEVEEEEVEEEEVEEEEVEAEEVEAEKVKKEEVEEEEVEEEEVEEEGGEELELVPVRIKKVTYWKDEKSGDIYEYLPGDDWGEKVGTYVDGKPTFS